MNEKIKPKKVVCAICKREFNSTSKNIKYCSLECRAIGRNYTKKLWLAGKENYMRDYMREYRSK